MKRFTCRSFWKAVNQVKVDEACCLFAIGELPPEEASQLRVHLQGCSRCRALVAEFERVMLFDLAAVAASRPSAHGAASGSIDGSELLRKVREKARAAPLECWTDGGKRIPFTSWSLGKCSASELSRFGVFAAIWTIAAALAFTHWQGAIQGLHTGAKYPVASGDARAAQQLVALQQRVLRTQADEEALREQLSRMSLLARDKERALAQIKAQDAGLSERNAALQATLKGARIALTQKSAELELSRNQMNQAIETTGLLQARLDEIGGRLEKQKDEVARLERVAASATNIVPEPERPFTEGEAKEILGARDLHIVDVLDVDGSGKPARAYGRIYFINHSQLIFYAFDLSPVERKHKLVAFQAWGFQQPSSSKVRSLGLFYLDNASLDRWALRVSDPQILSHIDTLFVTAEPPGGSRFPKGKRLLMASLVGPPNHP